jgi:hypothetical protein
MENEQFNKIPQTTTVDCMINHPVSRRNFLKIAALSVALTGFELSPFGRVQKAFAEHTSPWRFSDVPENHLYFTAIEDIAKRGIVEGYGDGTFGPNNPITRAEFAKIIDLAMGLVPTEEDKTCFPDVKDDDRLFPYHYIAKAAQEGIFIGFPDGTFKPNENISRTQIITAVVRAANKLMPGKLKQPPFLYKSSLGNFSDTYTESANWFQYNCLSNDLVKYGQTWNPWQSATRGEVAQIVYNLLNYNGETEKPRYPIIINGATEAQKAVVVDTIQSCLLDCNILLRTYGGVTFTFKDIDPPWVGTYLGKGEFELDENESLADLRVDTAHETCHLAEDFIFPTYNEEWSKLVGNDPSEEWKHNPIEHFYELFRIAFFDPAHGGALPIKTTLKFIPPEEMRKWVLERLPI